MQGFDTEDMDGLIGPKTINAVRAFQLNKSLRPDGYASFGLLKKYANQKGPALTYCKCGA